MKYLLLSLFTCLALASPALADNKKKNQQQSAPASAPARGGQQRQAQQRPMYQRQMQQRPMYQQRQVQQRPMYQQRPAYANTRSFSNQRNVSARQYQANAQLRNNRASLAHSRAAQTRQHLAKQQMPQNRAVNPRALQSSRHNMANARMSQAAHPVKAGHANIAAGRVLGKGTRTITAKGGRAVRIHPVSVAMKQRGYAHFHRAVAFYHHESHPRAYWQSHYGRVVFVHRGYYYFHEGYWFPAWGYASGAVYSYDGPIAACGGEDPGQVVVSVQNELQNRGYSIPDADGVLDADTRDSIAQFQQDAGLEVTSAIDEPTLEALGLI